MPVNEELWKGVQEKMKNRKSETSAPVPGESSTSLLDRIFLNLFAGHGLLPREQDWNAILGKLAAARRRRRIIWWSGSLAFILLAVSAFFALRRDSSVSLPAEKDSRAVVQQQNSTPASPEQAAGNQDDAETGNGDEVKQATSATLSGSSTAGSAGNQGSAGIATPKQHNSVVTSGKPVNISASTDGPAAGTAVAVNDRSEPEMIAIAARNGFIPVELFSYTPVRQNFTGFKPFPTSHDNGGTGKIELAAGSSLLYSSKTLSMPADPALAALRKNSEKGIVTLAPSLEIRAFRGNWMARSGVQQYSWGENARYNFVARVKTDSLPVKNPQGDTLGWFYFWADKKVDEQRKNRYSSVSVPVEIGHVFSLNSKTQLRVSGGVTLTYIRKIQAYYPHFASGNLPVSYGGLANRFQAGGVLAVALNRRIGNSWAWEIGLRSGSQLTNTFKAAAGFDQKNRYAGLDLKLVYMLR